MKFVSFSFLFTKLLVDCVNKPFYWTTYLFIAFCCRCYWGGHSNNVKTWSIKCSRSLHCRFCPIIFTTRQKTKFFGPFPSPFSHRSGERLYWRCLKFTYEFSCDEFYVFQFTTMTHSTIITKASVFWNSSVQKQSFFLDCLHRFVVLLSLTAVYLHVMPIWMQWRVSDIANRDCFVCFKRKIELLNGLNLHILTHFPLL